MFKLLRNKQGGGFPKFFLKKDMRRRYIRLLSEKTGQSMIVQYVVTFFLVVSFISAMSVYVQRLFQGRIRDARDYVALTANRAYVDAPGLNLQGGILREYEPYYSNQASSIYSSTEEGRRNIPTLANQTGIYQYDQDQNTTVGSYSNQAAPGNAI